MFLIKDSKSEQPCNLGVSRIKALIQRITYWCVDDESRVFRGEPHGFMHDLESIFWVPSWIFLHHDDINEKR